MRHYNCRIAIRLEALERDKIDRLIFERKFKNRSQAIRAALAEFNDKRLLSLAELDDDIEALRKRIKENVVPKLR